MSKPNRRLIARTLRETADWIDGDAPSRVVEEMELRARQRRRTPEGDREVVRDLTGSSQGWRNWDVAQRPEFPERPLPWVPVQSHEDPNTKARDYLEEFPDRAWVRLLIAGHNPHRVRVGGKGGIHREGKPIQVWIGGAVGTDAEVQGIEVDGYGGTFVQDLVVDDLAVRKSPGAKACIEDRAASGTWWLRNFRPRQNVEEARIFLDGLPGDHNYAGAKWAIKPSDGVDRLVVVDCPRVEDPVLRQYPMFWEHWAYLTAVKRYFFDNADLSGGNRTGMQDNTPRAKDGLAWPWQTCERAVVISCTMEVGTMWDHDEGGKALTSWQMAPGSIGLYAGNKIKSKYGCIGLAHQPTNADQYSDWPLPHNFADEGGFVHQGLWYILDNDCLVTEGSRSAISIDSCRHAHVEGNKIVHNGSGPLIVVDSETGLGYGAPRCNPIMITIDQPGVDVLTYRDGYKAW